MDVVAPDDIPVAFEGGFPWQSGYGHGSKNSQTLVASVT